MNVSECERVCLLSVKVALLRLVCASLGGGGGSGSTGNLGDREERKKATWWLLMVDTGCLRCWRDFVFDEQRWEAGR